MASITLNRVRGEFARNGLRGVIEIASQRLIGWFRAYRELKCNRTFSDSPALLAYTRAMAAGWFNPWQVDWEICELLDGVRHLRPRVILEIGTARGGTLFMLTRVAAADALLVSIDLPCGNFGGGFPRWRAPLYRRFALPGQRIELLRGDSQDLSMVERVRKLLNGRSIDFLFIDGDHSYDGVKRDNERFVCLVREGGLVALHDIQPIDDGSTEVPRYWRDIRETVSGRELVADSRQKGCGIGLYEVKKAHWRC